MDDPLGPRPWQRCGQQREGRELVHVGEGDGDRAVGRPRGAVRVAGKARERRCQRNVFFPVGKKSTAEGEADAVT